MERETRGRHRGRSEGNLSRTRDHYLSPNAERIRTQPSATLSRPGAQGGGAGGRKARAATGPAQAAAEARVRPHGPGRPRGGGRRLSGGGGTAALVARGSWLGGTRRSPGCDGAGGGGGGRGLRGSAAPCASARRGLGGGARRRRRVSFLRSIRRVRGVGRALLYLSMYFLSEVLSLPLRCTHRRLLVLCSIMLLHIDIT